MRSGIAIAFALGAIALAGCGAVPAAGVAPGRLPTAAAADPTITVQGEGKVSVPDSAATFQVGVQAQAATAAQALSSNNQAMTAVLGALEKQGETAQELTTEALSVYPQYTSSGPNAPARVTGYQATDTVQVKVPDATKVGPLIDAAMGAGANQLDSVSFGPPSGDALTQQALSAAVADARARAQAIAQEAHLTLGAITKVTTTQIQTPPVPTFAGQVFAAAAATPVESGSQQVTADVTVTFQAQ